MQTHSGSLIQLGLWPKVWVDPKTQNKSEEPHTFWEELSCTWYTFGDKSRFGEQEQRVAHFLEMAFLERNVTAWFSLDLFCYLFICVYMYLYVINCLCVYFGLGLMDFGVRREL